MSSRTRDSGLSYTSGWKTRDGRVLDTVTIVWPEALGRVLGTSDRTVVNRHLKALRASGVLLCGSRGFQSWVRLDGGQRRRGYVFACAPVQLPKPVDTGVRTRGRMRVFTA